MRMKRLGQRRLRDHELAQTRRGDARVDLGDVRFAASPITLPVAAEPVLHARVVFPTSLAELALEVLAPFDRDAIDLFATQRTELQEMLEVPFAHALSLGDRTVEER